MSNPSMFERTYIGPGSGSPDRVPAVLQLDIEGETAYRCFVPKESIPFFEEFVEQSVRDAVRIYGISRTPIRFYFCHLILCQPDFVNLSDFFCPYAKEFQYIPRYRLSTLEDYWQNLYPVSTLEDYYSDPGSVTP